MKTLGAVVLGLLLGLSLNLSRLSLAQSPAPCPTITPTRTTVPLPSATFTLIPTFTQHPVLLTATSIHQTQEAKGTVWLPTPTQEIWTATPAPLGAVYKVIASNGLNIRTGPSIGASIISVYPVGSMVWVTETQTDGYYVWGKTDKGWIAIQSGVYTLAVKQ